MNWFEGENFGSTGPITIGLHPALLQDEALYKHTFVHELLHAAGLTIHSKQRQVGITNCSRPSLKESPLLQKMRDAVLEIKRSNRGPVVIAALNGNAEQCVNHVDV